MTRLQRLFSEQGQSPWLDNLKRGYITSGELTRFIDEGIRGITSNPTIFQKAIAGQAAYDDQFRELTLRKAPVDHAYWDMVIDDVEATLASARDLHQRIDEPNLLVKIPATEAGIPAIRQMIAEGRSINVTLIFSLERYDQVIEAYLSGLEECDGDLSRVHS